MEKKKLLLIAVSVGIFLIIVIGLSILIFLPKNKDPQANSQFVTRLDASNSGARVAPGAGVSELVIESEPIFESREPATVDAVELLRNREDRVVLPPSPTSSGAVSSRSVGNNGSSLVIEVPRPSSAAIPNSTSSSQTVNSGSARSTASPQSLPSSDYAGVPPASTVSTAPQVSTATVAVSSQPAVSSSRGSPTKPAASIRSRENYWVQAGSFSTQIGAENVKETLAAKGITAIIENRDVNGKNYFRVRIGPYTSQNEADYWLAVIKNINGFESSQVWQNYSER